MILYWSLWVIFRLFFFGILRARVEGLHHFPRKGSFVLCSNHFSWLDPVLLGSTAPRRLHYMTKAEAFTFPAAALVLQTVGAFPVRRHTGDRRAIRRALGLLAAGRIVAVFPEGTRSRDGRLGRAEPGAALLASWGKAEIVPVAIRGRYRPGQLTLRFGPAFRLRTPCERPSAAELQRLAEDQILGAVRALLPVGEGKGPSRVAVGGA